MSEQLNERKYKLMIWGTGDVAKPRVRILIEIAKLSSESVKICIWPIWGKVQDKSQLGKLSMLLRLLALMVAYPILILRLLFSEKPDALLVTYLGHLDILVAFPIAKLRRIPILWDVFVPLHEAIVEDRRLIRPSSPIAVIVYCIEWLASRAASKIFLDTKAHAEYFEDKYKLSKNCVGVIPVGCEAIFRATDTKLLAESSPIKVLFYGQFIPLHGIKNIVEAARLSLQEKNSIIWEIVGCGQESQEIDQIIFEYRLTNVTRINWIPYNKLPQLISNATICLGIFGSSPKAQRVIPNKLYQMIAMQKPCITADSPAIRELFQPSPLLKLIPANNPQKLFAAVKETIAALPIEMFRDGTSHYAAKDLTKYFDKICFEAIGR